MANTDTQQTLDPDAQPRGAPRYCPECGERLVEPQLLDESLSRTQIWRRHRRSHYGWGDSGGDRGQYLLTDEDTLGTDAQRCLKRAADTETRTYTVEFHDEYVERVRVEAATESEATTLAESERTYDGEVLETIHTEARATTEPSLPSVDYIEHTSGLPDSIASADLSDAELAQLIDAVVEATE